MSLPYLEIIYNSNDMLVTGSIRLFISPASSLSPLSLPPSPPPTPNVVSSYQSRSASVWESTIARQPYKVINICYLQVAYNHFNATGMAVMS